MVAEFVYSLPQCYLFRYQIVREILDVDMDEREAAFKALQYNVNALEAYQTLQQIYGNLITFCKNVVVSGGICCEYIFLGDKISFLVKILCINEITLLVCLGIKFLLICHVFERGSTLNGDCVSAFGLMANMCNFESFAHSCAA